MDIGFPESDGDEPGDDEELEYLDDGRYLDDLMGNVWAHLTVIPPRVVARRRAVLAALGRAHLRLRLFRDWSQLEVERRSGVDQTTISRFERGDEQGLSIHRLAAMLTAIGVDAIEFRPPHRTNANAARADAVRRPMAEGRRRCRAPTGTAEAPSATITGSVYDIDAGPVRNCRRG